MDEERKPLKKDETCDQKNLRTEYKEVSGYYRTAMTFRFTTVGLYLAAVGLIARIEGISGVEKGILLLGITVPVWIIELRNRTVLRGLVERGMEIEHLWGYDQGTHAYDRFFQRIERDKKFLQKKDPDIEEPPPGKPQRFFFFTIPMPRSDLLLRLISHTNGIDLLFTFVAAYAIYLIRGT